MKFEMRLFTLLCLALCFAVFCGCMDGKLAFPNLDFSANWVSKDGSKTRSQLEEDMQACSHDARGMSTPAFPGEMGRSGADMKVFDACMQAKGWVKQK